MPLATDRGAYYFNLNGQPLAHMSRSHEEYPEIMKDVEDYSSVARFAKEQNIAHATEVQNDINRSLDAMHA